MNYKVKKITYTERKAILLFYMTIENDIISLREKLENLKKLNSIILYIKRKHPDLSIRLRCDKKRKCKPNGSFSFSLYKSYIEVYYRNKIDEANLIAAILLHEYGHYLFHEKNLKQHEEKAWSIGLKAIPKHLRLTGIKEFKKECLTQYGY